MNSMQLQSLGHQRQVTNVWRCVVFALLWSSLLVPRSCITLNRGSGHFWRASLIRGIVHRTNALLWGDCGRNEKPGVWPGFGLFFLSYEVVTVCNLELIKGPGGSWLLL